MVPNLERGSCLNAGAVDLHLFWGSLVLHLALMAVWNHSVDLRDEAEHKQPFPVKVRGCINSCVSQKLMSSLNDPVS